MRVLAHLEGDVLHVYIDSAGCETIGKGHKLSEREKSTGWFNGTQAHRDSTGRWAISQEQSDRIFQVDVQRFEDDIDRLVTVNLNPSQRDALAIWHFNTGGLEGSGLLRSLNLGLYDLVPGEMLRWNHVKDPKTGQKVVDKGLTARRQAEANLFIYGYGLHLNDGIAEAARLAAARQFSVIDLVDDHPAIEPEPEKDPAA